MAAHNDAALSDLSILIRAVENVFRKLIRLLIGRISLKKLQDLIQIIFVEEAEAKLKQETPGQNVALGDLVLLTGVDTRTIKKTRTYIALSKPIHQDESFLSEIIPECCILDIWGSSSKYTDKKTGKPKILKLRGPDASFESLIRESISTRGVSVKSFLQRLVASKSIRLLREKNEVQLLERQYTSFGSRNQTANLKIGFAAVGNLLDTIAHNLLAPEQGEEAFYQRGVWSSRLNNQDSRKLRRLTSQFLLQTDEKVRDLIKPYEQESASDELVTAGISMFYFEEKMDSLP